VGTKNNQYWPVEVCGLLQTELFVSIGTSTGLSPDNLKYAEKYQRKTKHGSIA
jgi:hypothetical protein